MRRDVEFLFHEQEQGNGDSFCTVGLPRKMSGRKPPFLRNLRKEGKRKKKKKRE